VPPIASQDKAFSSQCLPNTFE